MTLTTPFEMSITEMTRGEGLELLQWAYEQGYVDVNWDDENPYERKIIDNLGTENEVLLYLFSNDFEFSDGVFSTVYANRPLRGVTWYGAASICNWMSLKQGIPAAYDHNTWLCNGNDPYNAEGFRLPTEAEWEYACRAGTDTYFANGNGDYQIHCGNLVFDEIGWGPCTYDDSVEVAKLIPNAWGLYDMHGLLWEWCNDIYAEYPDSAVTDPVGPESGWFYVKRGGSFSFTPLFCRSANRSRYRPDRSVAGVRYVRSLQ
ncbi:MAG: formylglycine-generating enzyme family protein [Candidatus Krumholzibacteria bacterium]|nr:formylglycine-generating enzyme family protein [Candidatus Krumholzibacteria bacterium]MDP6668512.1 formylglycine-generating enzyme family protein [Candidatus Krumholzibacteria bacterium]MDP6797814.1 formylglycine-generating enzyme family protein [Candidatus Krumholzibacteria bacterium]MDP7021393.1 formylglycine-generating enzyme family protein [Candidatus Krumholzibacteria bacterium]